MERVVFITAGDKEFYQEAWCIGKRAKELGYEWEHLELKDSDDLAKNSTGFIPCKFKPALIQSICERLEDGLYVYVDCDVALIKELDDDVHEEYDFGVVLRPSDEISREKHQPDVGRFNTGVLFFRSSALHIVTPWLDAAQKRTTEQRALNELIANHNPVGLKIFPNTKYNSYSLEPDTSLLHCKSERARIHEYCNGCA